MLQPLAVIIEDQNNLAVLYEDTLRLIGYNTVSIRNGLEALNYLETNDIPDLVILDVNLPGMSGRDILKHIRKSERYATLPVIVLTANTLMISQMRSEVTKLDYLFVKPISMGKLQELAKSVQRGADGLPGHMAKTQKVPQLDEQGNLVTATLPKAVPENPDLKPTAPLDSEEVRRIIESRAKTKKPSSTSDPDDTNE